MKNLNQFHTYVLFENTYKTFPIYENVLKSVNPKLQVIKTRMSDRYDVIINFDNNEEHQKFLDEIIKQGINFEVK